MINARSDKIERAGTVPRDEVALKEPERNGRERERVAGADLTEPVRCAVDQTGTCCANTTTQDVECLFDGRVINNLARREIR